MIRHGGRISESLLRLREVIVSQQAALLERSKEQVMNKAGKHGSSDDGQEPSFAGSDPNKKRRGVSFSYLLSWIHRLTLYVACCTSWSMSFM